MQNGNWVMRHCCRGGTLVVYVTGLVTLDTMRDLRAEAFRLLMENDARRMLVDFENTAMLISAHGWDTLAREDASPHRVSIPTGVLAPKAGSQAMCDYCSTLAAKGRPIAAFTDPVTAYLWANVPRGISSLRPKVPRKRATGPSHADPGSKA